MKHGTFIILFLYSLQAEACYRYSKEKPNPCDDLRCGPGEDCVVTQKNGILFADCICPKSCPNYGDSVDSSPVCSSTGIDYPSLCHMKQHACSTATNMTAKYFGKCDPCEGHQCPQGTSCHLNAQRNPECRCSEQCSLTYNPICASDGKTYTNECVMKVSACKEETTLSVYKTGKCDESSPCSSVKCSHGEECTISEVGVASCGCSQKCPRIMKPVCATNGMTFDNECELHRFACNNRSRIVLRHQGSCGDGVCVSFTSCRPPQVCSVVGGKPECTCPKCGDELREVCGSDGRTYPNECKMRRSACLSEKTLFVKHNGICEGCARVECAFYADCVSDGRGRGQCQCPAHCPPANNETSKISTVCGTDGVTYSSDCHLRRSACQQSKFIVVAFHGKCDACLHVECRYGEECRGGVCVCSYNCPSNPAASQRVCGENGVLYPSLCHLQLASCQKGSPIPEMPPAHCHSAVATFEARYRCSLANCRFGGSCSVDRSQCLCQFPCIERDYPLCGSDRLIYSNQCHMNIIACRDQREIHVLPRLSQCDVEHEDSCECNRVGSYGPTCDSSGQCKCRPGVGGSKCDHCLPSFWGIHLIAQGSLSCQPCGCSAFGSARPDCEQTTGRCECRRGALGEKCDRCGSDMLMTPSGCVKKEEYKTPGECSSLICHHGAVCVSSPGSLPDCQCSHECGLRNMGIAANMSVCGSDGVTYDSACQLRRFACKHQIDLVVSSLGICDQEADLLPAQERSERDENKAVRLGSHCTLPSDCAELNAVCVTRPGTRGVCGCGIGSSRQGETCVDDVDDTASKFVNISLNGREGKRIAVDEGTNLFINVSMTFFSRISHGILLTARGVSGQLLVMRMENRRLVVEIGTESMHSRDYLALHVNHTFQLTWKRKVVTLTTADGKVSSRISSENEPIQSVWIGTDPDVLSHSIDGVVAQVAINDILIKKHSIIVDNATQIAQSHPFLNQHTLDGSESIEIPNVRIEVRSTAAIQIEIKPNTTDGLIFYWGTVKDGRAAGDFLALFLVASQPFFCWNLGSGIAYVKSSPISSQRWSTVTFGRELRNGSISVDDLPTNYQQSMPKNQHLDVAGESIFVGGVPNLEMIPTKLRKLNTTFRGHVGKMMVNGHYMDLNQGKSHGTPRTQYVSPLCETLKCPSKAICFEKQNKAACRDSTPAAIQLDGYGELAYLNQGNRSQFSSKMSEFGVSFRTKSPDGILWWEAASNYTKDGDFLVIYLEAGTLKLGLNLGADIKFKPVKIKNKLDDNKWHSLAVKRTSRRVSISLDGRPQISVVASPAEEELDTDGLVYLGGPSFPKSNIPVSKQFRGCLKELVINNLSVNISFDSITDYVPKNC